MSGYRAVRFSNRTLTLLKPASLRLVREARHTCLARIQGSMDLELLGRKRHEVLSVDNIERLSLKWSPYVDGYPPSGCKHPIHFTHTLRTIRKVLETLLAEHDIEATIVKWQFGRTAQMPVNVRSCPSCSVQHHLIDINASDLAGRPADGIDFTGDQTRATCDIENSVAIFALGLADQVLGPRLLHRIGIAHVERRRIAAAPANRFPVAPRSPLSRRGWQPSQVCQASTQSK